MSVDSEKSSPVGAGTGAAMEPLMSLRILTGEMDLPAEDKMISLISCRIEMSSRDSWSSVGDQKV